jgi:hypothetical protein
MAGDISRNTFDPARHYSRVLMQQGRVLLDSDWNEQTSLHLHYLRSLAADLIGPAGGPRDACGFKIVAPGGGVIVVDGEARDFPRAERGETEAIGGMPILPGEADRRRRLEALDAPRNFLVGPGRYYVNGILCENEQPVLFRRAEKGNAPVQPDYFADPLEDDTTYLVFLIVWERDINALEDEGIREVALGAHSPDTASRAKVVWQVFAENERGQFASPDLTATNVLSSPQWQERVRAWQPINRGMLRAKADEADDPNAASPCLISPDVRYRGENQLYRVEIHRGGGISRAWFKWSRENASVNLSVREISGQQLTMESLGRDSRLGLQVGDLVELTDDGYAIERGEESLLTVTDIDPDEFIVTVDKVPPSVVVNRTHRPYILRRWEGAGPIKEATGANENWIELEDGVKIQFAQDAADYRVGDYWLIPARAATGDVEWPGPVGDPEPRPPHGVDRHLAPLAVIRVEDGAVTVEKDFRLAFAPLATTPAEPA